MKSTRGLIAAENLAQEKMKKTKTSFDYGREFAIWGKNENLDGFDHAVIFGTRLEIPSDDYSQMERDGVSNPNANDYWRGFNSIFKSLHDEAPSPMPK